MKPMTEPRTYRLPAQQHEWLEQQAEREGHFKKVFVLRRLIHEAMKKSGRKNGKDGAS
jgi:hypothetical protein